MRKHRCIADALVTSVIPNTTRFVALFKDGDGLEFLFGKKISAYNLSIIHVRSQKAKANVLCDSQATRPCADNSHPFNLHGNSRK